MCCMYLVHEFAGPINKMSTFGADSILVLVITNQILALIPKGSNDSTIFCCLVCS